MAKKKVKNEKSTLNTMCRKMTLREENLGKTHVSVSSMLKMEHLQNITMWASKESSLSGLAALFGRQLASNAEASGISLDRSLISCQRCETLLQPGDNCTIRIEKNATKAKHKNKSSPPQNNVVYTCHFCSHRNVRRGTSRGHVKELLASRAAGCINTSVAAPPSHVAELESLESKEESAVETEVFVDVKKGRGNTSLVSREKIEPRSVSTVEGTSKGKGILTVDGSITPTDALLARKGVQGGSGPTKSAGSRRSSAAIESTNCTRGCSSKRKRKGWSSLKDIVENNEQASKHNRSSLTIPFRL